MTAFLIGLKVEQFALFFVFAGGVVISFAKLEKEPHGGEDCDGSLVVLWAAGLWAILCRCLRTCRNHRLCGNGGPAAASGIVGRHRADRADSGLGGDHRRGAEVSGSGGDVDVGALPLVFGSNIGTTITGVFAAIGGSLAAKRTARLTTLFNVDRHPDRRFCFSRLSC